MAVHAPDHAGLEVLPLEDCLRLLASVPLGRVSFSADGEIVVLPVNHVVDGQDVLFRTASGAKLEAAADEDPVTFEADDYDQQLRSGWSVVVSGHARVVYDDAEIRSLDRLGLHSWAEQADRSFWVRIRPVTVTGRVLPPRGGPVSPAGRPAAAGPPATGPHTTGPHTTGPHTTGPHTTGPHTTGPHTTGPQVFDVLRGEARHIRPTPFGEVGTLFSGHGVELVWVSKSGEALDENWFSSHEVDLMLVVQGQLKVDFEAPDLPGRVLRTGEVLVLPARTRCRAYRWPRDAPTATIFVAAYPVARNPVARNPVARNPVARNPVARNPVARNPVARNPVARNPAD